MDICCIVSETLEACCFIANKFPLLLQKDYHRLLLFSNAKNLNSNSGNIIFFMLRQFYYQ